MDTERDYPLFLVIDDDVTIDGAAGCWRRCAATSSLRSPDPRLTHPLNKGIAAAYAHGCGQTALLAAPDPLADRIRADRALPAGPRLRGERVDPLRRRRKRLQ